MGGFNSIMIHSKNKDPLFNHFDESSYPELVKYFEKYLQNVKSGFYCNYDQADGQVKIFTFLYEKSSKSFSLEISCRGHLGITAIHGDVIIKLPEIEEVGGYLLSIVRMNKINSIL